MKVPTKTIYLQKSILQVFVNQDQWFGTFQQIFFVLFLYNCILLSKNSGRINKINLYNLNFSCKQKIFEYIRGKNNQADLNSKPN